MILKVFHKLLPLTFLTFTLPLVSTMKYEETNIQSNLTVNQYSSNNNDPNSTTKWEQTIVESSNNSNVKIFFTRNATIAFQQELIATNYMLQSRYNKQVNDEIVWFVDYDLYDSQKYNFEYYNKTYGYLNEANNLGYTFSIYSRTSETGFSNSQELSNNKYQILPSENNLNDIVEHYVQKYGENVKFDVWIPDASIVDMWNKQILSSSPNSFYEFVKHVEKFNIVSDGNWQTFNLVKNVVNRLNSNNYQQLSDQEIETMFINVKNDTNNQYYSTFQKYDFFDLVQYEKMFTVFHTKSYTSSPYYKYPEEFKLYNAYSIDYDYVSMANKYFSSDKNLKDKFIFDFETFFNIQNNKSLSDFVWKNIESYDPTKKNIIWMGDSLIRPDSNGNEIYRYPEKQDEINNIVKAYVTKYPVSEYNYFVKHHPSFSHDYQENLNQYLFKDIIDPICMDPFPWELFLSWDHKMQLDYPNSYSPLFSETSNDELIPKTKLIGVQYTTTTIQTTAFYLSTTYNMSIENINKSVGIDDWPIPMTFDIITRTIGYFIDPYEQFRINYEKINQIYEPFSMLNIFPNYVSNATSSLDYIKEVIGNNNSFKLKPAFTYQSLTTIILSSIFVITIITTISVCVFKQRKLIKNKKQN